jgi:tRNA(Ile)-lysidine synthase
MATSKSLLFEQALATSWPPTQWQDLTVVVAVSGGPDSVALLRAMATLKPESGGAGRLIVAHLNHHLRPEADGDARFVVALAGQLELPYAEDSAAVAELAARQGDGIEAAARGARYKFLQETAQKFGARYVATAHTANDQIETVLLNVLRGTGLAGLAGMPRARPLGSAVSLIRPLLDIRREEVLKYLDEIGQRYCVDSSNASHNFIRNRVRHELLPLVREKYNPEIESTMTRLSKLAGDAQRLIEQLAEDLLQRSASSEIPPPGLARRSSDREICLDTDSLANVNRHLLREMFVVLWRRMDWPLQSMGFDQWDSLAEMADPGGKKTDGETARKRVFPGNIIVERRGPELCLTAALG